VDEHEQEHAEFRHDEDAPWVSVRGAVSAEFDTTATAVSKSADGGGVDAKTGWVGEREDEESLGEAVSDCGGDKWGANSGRVPGGPRRRHDGSHSLRKGGEDFPSLDRCLRGVHTVSFTFFFFAAPGVRFIGDFVYYFDVSQS